MQVVYSGGSNTPTPSPRLQRKTGYGRPVMPGYMTHVHPQILVQRSREKLTEGDTTLRDSIPAMSKGVAVLCLVLNIIIPGSGMLIRLLLVLNGQHAVNEKEIKRNPSLFGLTSLFKGSSLFTNLQRSTQVYVNNTLYIILVLYQIKSYKYWYECR